MSPASWDTFTEFNTDLDGWPFDQDACGRRATARDADATAAFAGIRSRPPTAGHRPAPAPAPARTPRAGQLPGNWPSWSHAECWRYLDDWPATAAPWAGSAYSHGNLMMPAADDYLLNGKIPMDG